MLNFLTSEDVWQIIDCMPSVHTYCDKIVILNNINILFIDDEF